MVCGSVRMKARVAALVHGTRLEPLARELLRATWPRWRRLDARDNDDLARVLATVLTETSSCVDVGAHQGGILAQMVRLAPRGRHFAFEPLPRLAAALRARFPAVTVHELALSDGAGEATFQHVVDDPGYSGFRRRTYELAHPRIETLTVRTARLDDLLPPDLGIHFVKVDVEGAELEVFRGALRTLRRWRPYVAFEHGRGAADHYGTTPEMVHDLLEECGLSIFALDGAGPYGRAEFTAVFQAGARWNFLARPYRAQST